MNPLSPRPRPALALLLAGLAACSGPVSDGGLAGIGGTGISDGGALAGIGGTGITTTGTITGFGSIFVNGIEFDTSGARISLDGRPGEEQALGLGMVVTVSGVVDDSGQRGVAEQVIFDDAVQGPVAALQTSPDGQRRNFTVLGETVQVERATTVFAHTGFDRLAAGDVVEVSGFRTGDGRLYATRVEKKGDFRPGDSEVERKGRVQGLSGSRFTLDGLTVEAAGADLSGLPGGALQEGLAVEVQGTLTATTIVARRIRPEDDPLAGASGRLSVEGLVSDYRSRADFRVQGQRVDAAGARLEPAGLTLRNGLAVEVEGVREGDLLRAVRVSARDGDIEAQARVGAVDPAAGTLRLDYVPGPLTVRVDSRTLLQDDDHQPLRLDRLAVGDFVSVHGYRSGAAIVARTLQRDRPGDDQLQAPADACDGSTVTLLGLSFTLQPGTTEFEGAADADALCSAAAGGRLVEVEDRAGQRDGIADKIEVKGGPPGGPRSGEGGDGAAAPDDGNDAPSGDDDGSATDDGDDSATGDDDGSASSDDPDSAAPDDGSDSPTEDDSGSATNDGEDSASGDDDGNASPDDSDSAASDDGSDSLAEDDSGSASDDGEDSASGDDDGSAGSGDPDSAAAGDGSDSPAAAEDDSGSDGGAESDGGDATGEADTRQDGDEDGPDDGPADEGDEAD